jgi:hypothetical protein
VRFSAPLIPARFLERRKRFLALVELPDQSRVWVHVPNSGALTGCLDPGQEILLTHDERPGRKTAYTWRFVRGTAGWICIDTLAPNRLVAEALAAGALPGLPFPSRVRAEVPIPQGSRLDFVLEGRQTPVPGNQERHLGGRRGALFHGVTSRGGATWSIAGWRGRGIRPGTSLWSSARTPRCCGPPRHRSGLCPGTGHCGPGVNIMVLQEKSIPGNYPCVPSSFDLT